MVTDVAIPRTLLVVNASVQARSFGGLLAAIRGAPGRYAMGSWGPGTLPHQLQSYIDKRYGTQTTHVPYRGEAPMVADLLAGVIPMSVATLTTTRQHIATGRLRAIAVFGAHRIDALPGVPTFAEQGFDDPVYRMEGPISLMVPAHTPQEVVQRIAQDVRELLAQDELRRRIAEMGADPVGNTPAEAQAAWRALIPVALELAKGTGVVLD